MNRRLTIKEFIFTRFMIFMALCFVLIPLIWVISLSFRQPDQMYESYLFIFPKSVTVSNYFGAVDFVNNIMKTSFSNMFINGFIITFSTIIIALIISSLAAFSFSYYNFRGKEILFILVLLVFMVPQGLLIIPVFQLLKNLSLINTYLGVILAHVSLQIPLTVLILRSFFEELPSELKDAAVIDGASDFKYFLSIVIPLSKPAIATVVIFMFLIVWNDFLYVLVFLHKTEMQTVPLVLSNLISARGKVDWGIYGASVVMAAAPVVVIFFTLQRWFIRGLTMGSLKG